MADINIQEYVEKALAAVKNSPDKLKELLSGNGQDALKKILGDDGKLSKDDLQKILNELKSSDISKELLGDDGKFDMSDVTRIAKDAEKEAESLLGGVKNLFGKK